MRNGPSLDNCKKNKLKKVQSFWKLSQDKRQVGNQGLKEQPRRENVSVTFPESMEIWSHHLLVLVPGPEGASMDQIKTCSLLTNESISHSKLMTFSELLPTQRNKQFIWIRFAFLCKVISIKQKKERLYFVLTCLCLTLWPGLQISQKNPPVVQHSSSLHYWTAAFLVPHQSNWTTWNQFKRKY